MTPPAAEREAPKEGDWICANCGAVHETNANPCRECAYERFAQLEPETTSPVESAVSVEYQCQECGKRQPQNSTPCNRCGNVTFDPVQSGGATSQPSDQDGAGARSKITAGKVIGYAYGAFTIFNGLGFLIIGAFAAGLFWIAGGLVAMSITRARIESVLSADLSRGATVVTVLALHFVASILVVAAAV